MMPAQAYTAGMEQEKLIPAEETDGRVRSGRARMEKLTPEERRQLASKAASARWSQEKAMDTIAKATHTGTLKIGDLELDCAVLDNGERVLSQGGVASALGVGTGGAVAAGRITEDGEHLPLFLAFKNLRRFIDKDLAMVLSNPLKFRHPRGGVPGYGMKAELIPRVCDVWLKARDAGVLRSTQLRVAKKADIIMRGLAHVGIIALVDEATGYQADRARDALARILEAFIAKELRPWARTFQPEFYEELLRLRGLRFDGTLKQPRYIGTLTDNIVYKRLAPGVRDELKRINPANAKGQRRHKHFQWLTQQVGYQKLQQHLAAVTALMKVFDDYDSFISALDRALPVQTTAPLFDNVDDQGAKLLPSETAGPAPKG